VRYEPFVLPTKDERRIAANIAKLPELNLVSRLNQPSSQERLSGALVMARPVYH
jgi:hypothetical protein